MILLFPLRFGSNYQSVGPIRRTLLLANKALAWDAVCVCVSLAIAVGREVIVPPLCLDSTETEVIAAGDTSASFLTPAPLHSL